MVAEKQTNDSNLEEYTNNIRHKNDFQRFDAGVAAGSYFELLSFFGVRYSTV
jgi:hypothetical protein